VGDVIILPSARCCQEKRSGEEIRKKPGEEIGSKDPSKVLETLGLAT
jgi:hypothetical protein